MMAVTNTDPTRKGLIAWFRPDVRRAVTRAWLRAFVLVVLAMLVLALPMGLQTANEVLRVACWVVGGAFLLSGPISLMVRLQRILGPEIILSVHQAGLRWQKGDEVREVPWARVERFTVDEGGAALRVEVEAPGEPLVIDEVFTDLTLPELAAVLEDYWRKALMGLPLRGRPGA